jgi:hypothetical protein
MAGPYKVVLAFSVRKQGWQEVYYTQAGDPTTAESAAVALATIRNDLLALPANLDSYRVSDESTPRSGFLVPWTAPPPTPWVSQADEDDVSAMMRLYSSGDLRSRPLFLRGNPDNAFDTSDPTNTDRQGWLIKFGRLGDFLRNVGTFAVGNWVIKKRPRPGAGTAFPIGSWVPNAVSVNTDIIVDAPLAIGAKMALQIYGVKGLPFAPGLVKVQKFTVVGGNTNVTIVYRTPSDYVYPGGGTAVVYLPTYDAITSFANMPRFGRRITGRPFDLTRGRRRSIRR